VNAVYTECSIALSGSDPVVGGNRVIIRIGDHGGGPFLVIRGENGEPYEDETPHDFFLCTEDDIDKFAAICKNMLKQAERAPVAVISGDNDGGKA